MFQTKLSEYVVTKRGTACSTVSGPSPFNVDYIDLCKRMVAGFESITVAPLKTEAGIEHERAFQQKDAVAFIRSKTQISAAGAQSILQALCDQGVIARSDGETENVAATECAFVVTRLGAQLMKDTADSTTADDTHVGLSSLVAHRHHSSVGAAGSTNRLSLARTVASVAPPPPLLWSPDAGLSIEAIDANELARQLSLLFLVPFVCFVGAYQN